MAEIKWKKLLDLDKVFVLGKLAKIKTSWIVPDLQ